MFPDETLIRDLIPQYGVLSCLCLDCRHRGDLPLPALLEHCGEWGRLWSVRRHLVCKVCGSRNVHSRPEIRRSWEGEWVERRRSWVPAKGLGIEQKAPIRG